MPIRFTCQHCGKRLSTPSRFGGRTGACPNCREPIAIPSRPGSRSTVDPAESTTESTEELDSDWIYEIESSDDVAAEVDVRRLSIPRWVVFTQGGLLAAVGLGAFWLGLLSAGPRDGGFGARPAGPVRLSGTVTYQSRSSRALPDSGAAIIVVPKNRQPDANDRWEVAGLRPGDPEPMPTHDVLRLLRMLGGGYARSDAEGRFSIKLPEKGQFFLLVVSGHAKLLDERSIERRDLAQIGRYFMPATELIRDNQYEWREVSLSDDTQLQLTYE